MFSNLPEGVCDKCGGFVPKENDMIWVMAEIPGYETFPLRYLSRHFLPVVEDGVRRCEGSPSRAQYIKGQSRDLRGYKYLKVLEPIIREAYAKNLKRSQ